MMSYINAPDVDPVDGIWQISKESGIRLKDLLNDKSAGFQFEANEIRSTYVPVHFKSLAMHPEVISQISTNPSDDPA